MQSIGDYENKVDAGSSEDSSQKRSGTEDNKLNDTANKASDGKEKAPIADDESRALSQADTLAKDEKDMSATDREAAMCTCASPRAKDVVAHDVAPSHVPPKSPVQLLIPQKRRLTIRDCIIEGGLKPHADPSIANRLISNADGRADKLSKQDSTEYVVTSETIKSGVQFIETAVTKEEDVHPDAVPIPATTIHQNRQRDTESESSFNTETESRSTSSPIFSLELGTGKSSPLVTASQVACAIKGKVKSTKLVQTHINLGQNPLTTCHICKFTYNITAPDDVKAHTKYHNDLANPFSVAKFKIDAPNAPKKIKSWVGVYGQYIVAVDLHSSEPWKKMAEKVIRHVEGELNSQELPTDSLWGTMPDPGVTVDTSVVVSGSPTKRFKVYLYISDKKVAALLLAERIADGFVTKYGPLDVNEYGESIPGEGQVRLHPNHTEEVRTALLGVHYVWTHPDHRHQGYATRLLDAARHGDFIYGIHITREQVAWTSTTNAGRDFAGWYITGDKYADRWEMILY
jgi:GNAT superfamily N-acetyltransferase